MSERTLKIKPWRQGALKEALNESGWLDEEVLAAGHLRQGKGVTFLRVITGAVLWDVVRPRRTRLLPRHFVLALTPTRLVAFKATAGDEGRNVSNTDEAYGRVYTVRIHHGVAAEHPRDGARVIMPKGLRSFGFELLVAGERCAVMRPSGEEPNTNEFLLTLHGSDADGDDAHPVQRMRKPERERVTVVSATPPRPGGGALQYVRLEVLAGPGGLFVDPITYECLAPVDRWPAAGMTLPATVDRSNPDRMRIDWGEQPAPVSGAA